MDRNLLYHLILPAIMPVCFFAIAATPVWVFGCLMRGLIALTITLLSGLAAVVAAFIGARGRMRGEANTGWWVASSLVLAVPVVGMLILA